MPSQRGAAMTWAELHGVLRGRGLIRADDALRREAVGRRRHRRRVRLARGRRRAGVRRARRASTPTARRSRGRRSSAARRDRLRAAGAARRARAVGDRRRRAARAGAARGGVLRPSEPRDAGGRHHRHERQDDDGVSARVDLRGRGHPLRHARHRRRTASATRCARRRGRRPRRPTCRRCCARWSTAGCGACAMEVSSHALALRRVDGMHVRRRRLHEPDARSPRLPRATWTTYFRAKRRLFEMLPRDAPSLINVDDPRGAALVDVGGAAGDLRDQPAGRRHARAAVVLARRADVRRPHAARHAARRVDARRPAERLQHPRRGRRRRRRSTCRSTRSSAASQALDGVPGRFQVVSGADGRRHGRRRLRAHRRRAAEPARDGAAAGARPADHGVRLRRRSRSDEASADGRGRRAAERSSS